VRERERDTETNTYGLSTTLHLSLSLPVSLSLSLCACGRECVCVCVCMFVSGRGTTHSQTCIHTHTHTLSHTHTHLLTPLSLPPAPHIPFPTSLPSRFWPYLFPITSQPISDPYPHDFGPTSTPSPPNPSLLNFGYTRTLIHSHTHSLTYSPLPPPSTSHPISDLTTLTILALSLPHHLTTHFRPISSRFWPYLDPITSQPITIEFWIHSHTHTLTHTLTYLLPSPSPQHLTSHFRPHYPHDFGPISSPSPHNPFPTHILTILALPRPHHLPTHHY
jgi:hypothetical protein